MRIAVIGAGYVGLITSACLASFGHKVVCVDKNVDFIDQLKNEKLPFFEPDLEDLLQTSDVQERLSFAHDTHQATRDADLAFIAVGTPEGSDGEADTSAIFTVIETIAPSLKANASVILKSTVPVGTNKKVTSALERLERSDVSVISNPEFLREGSAIVDFMAPDRLIVGTKNEEDRRTIKTLYRPLLEKKIPLVFTTPESAELIKYASNSFLAMKVTFINQIADLCEKAGGTIKDVVTGMGLDHRINPYFLNPGPGYGGSCFPKDTRAIQATAKKNGVSLSLVQETIHANEERKQHMADRIENLCDGTVKEKKIAIFGVTFKANTDDTRESPTLTIASLLEQKGAQVTLFDPQAKKSVERFFEGATLLDSPYEAIQKADVLIILTEWPMLRELNLERLAQAMNTPLMIDLRNLYDPNDVREAGFAYHGIGYGTLKPS